MVAISRLFQDVVNSKATLVGGFTATATNTLWITLEAGRVYEFVDTDATPVAGGVLAIDNTPIMQQGMAAGQSVLLNSVAGMSNGTSRWALIQVGFAQADQVAGDDPNGGLLNFFNIDDPTQPLVGPGGDDLPLPTVRAGTAVVSVVYGAPATTGSEVPPNPSAGSVGLYLIDLAFGQTVVAQGNILVAGPSVGTGVPSNYGYAPFIRGLLTNGFSDLYSHHKGIPGHASKVDLPSETQGSLPADRITGAIPAIQVSNLIVGVVDFWVDPSNAGSDSNDGSQAHPWKTLQGAANNLNASGFAGGLVQLHLVDGTHPNLGGGTNTAFFVTRGNWKLIGNYTTPANVVLLSTGPGIHAQDTASVSFGGITLNCANFYPCSAFYGGRIKFDKVDFKASAQSQVIAFGGGSVTLEAQDNAGAGTYTISGNAPTHFESTNGQIIASQSSWGVTATLVGTPAFTSGFALAQDLGYIYAWQSHLAGTGASGSTPPYSLKTNGIIRTNNGNTAGIAGYFPGGAAALDDGLGGHIT